MPHYFGNGELDGQENWYSTSCRLPVQEKKREH